SQHQRAEVGIARQQGFPLIGMMPKQMTRSHGAHTIDRVPKLKGTRTITVTTDAQGHVLSVNCTSVPSKVPVPRLSWPIAPWPFWWIYSDSSLPRAAAANSAALRQRRF